MPKTRDAITVPGDYVSDCRCETRLAAEVGLHFPSCIACGKSVNWSLFVEKPRGERAAVATGDPKSALLIKHGFAWMQSMGVWSNDAQRKMISERAVEGMSVLALRAFVERPPQADWLKIFAP